MASTELPRLRGSINALKGHLTRTLDRVDKFLIHSVNETTRDSALSFQNEITKKHEMLEEAVLAASSISEEEYDVQSEGMVKYEERVASVRASIAKLLTDLNQSASESLLNTSTSSTAASSGSAGKRQFDVNLLRPFLLTPEHAPADFRTWKEEFASFYSGYGMEHHPLEQQQALFRKCISSEFWESHSPPNPCQLAGLLCHVGPKLPTGARRHFLASVSSLHPTVGVRGNRPRNGGIAAGLP